MTVVGADCGAEFARVAGGVQCDEDFLPFADSAFDLVLSVGTLDTVNDLPGALVLVRRVLRADGLFLAAFCGAGSLPGLRSALRAAEEAQGYPPSARIHPQIDVRAAGDLLTRAGFALPVVDSDLVTVRYPNLMRLVRDLRGMAATNLLSLRSAEGFGRLGLGAALADFAGRADPDGKTSEQFNILHLTGWAPAPSQPQPAKRGSATTSLADVLRKRD
jgi:SAM-dependent methyltransferase